MHHNKNTPRVCLVLSLFTCLATPFLTAQVAFTGAAYTENFDTLPVYTGSGTATLTYTNNSTITGWYSSVGTGANNARSSAGAQAASGELYNFGSSEETDRALSLFAADGYDPTAYLGAQLRNDSGATIDSVTLSFDVEQWRRNVNAVEWNFAYLVTSTTGSQLAASGYTANAGGNAASSVTGSARGLDGNGNATPVSVTLTGLNWQAGEYLWLRWASDQGGTSAAIALDNVSVSLSTIPEPTTAAVWIGGGVLLLGALRRAGRG